MTTVVDVRPGVVARLWRFFSLAASTPDGLQRAAAEWVEVEAPYRRVDVEGISGLLEQLAELARMARDRGDGLYCWMCV
jgi:hypothetical protein